MKQDMYEDFEPLLWLQVIKRFNQFSRDELNELLDDINNMHINDNDKFIKDTDDLNRQIHEKLTEITEKQLYMQVLIGSKTQRPT